MGRIMTLIVAAITAIVELILLAVHLYNKEKKSKITAKLVKPKRIILPATPAQPVVPVWMTQDMATGDRRSDRPDTTGLEVVELDSETYDEFVRQMHNSQK